VRTTRIVLLTVIDCQSSTHEQTTLDGTFTRQPKVPAFTTDGLLDYIVELIVCEDKVMPTLRFQSF
jgi:hypothetical protein